MSFALPSLFFTWILPLVAVPVAIHLINMMRHRRVPWAAMEFLLESKKKNQNWIQLKQLLLLLLRMAVIAAIVFMMAGPLLQDQWSKLFGGGKTHHMVLVDDSGSMADRWDGTSAFGRARDVVDNLVVRAGRESAEQSLTFVSFSDAMAGRSPRVKHQPITPDFEVEFDKLRENLAPTELAVGPLSAVEAIRTSLEPDPDENLVVYVVSDFRSGQWRDATAMRQALQGLVEMGAQIQFIQCVDEARSNLAITHLAPAPGQQAVGVLIKMDIDITNYGTQTVRNVPVQLQKTVYREAADREGEVGSLGAMKFGRIDPGQTVRRSFDVTFSAAGHHEVSARLPADSIEADNDRFCVVDVVPEVPVLIVDGGGEDNPLFLQIALAPSAQVKTGLTVKTETPAYLRDHALDKFHTVYLLNISQLDAQEIATLDAYVRGGGGVVFYSGPSMGRTFVNEELYRGGEGFYPLALATPTTLLVDRLEKAPDVNVQHDHPIFVGTFASKYNSWLQAIVVERYIEAAKTWRADDDPNVEVIASLRNGAPLMVEKKVGKGRVIAVLTTVSPLWHNWALANPTFIVATLETQVYLGAAKRADAERQVGMPLVVSFPEETYQSDVQFYLPGAEGTREVTAIAEIDPDDPAQRTVSLEDVQRRGVYEAQLHRTDGTSEARRFAYNTDTSEGDLRTVSQGELRALLKDVPFEYRDAGEFLAPVEQQAGFPLAEQWWFFLALILVLVCEQLLAYSASYHPRRKGGSGR